MHLNRKFPNTRLRRLRKNTNLIDLVSETNITSNDLIPVSYTHLTLPTKVEG